MHGGHNGNGCDMVEELGATGYSGYSATLSISRRAHSDIAVKFMVAAFTSAYFGARTGLN